VELQILGYHEQIRSQGATQPTRVTV
jgi:hypothetical protein